MFSPHGRRWPCKAGRSVAQGPMTRRRFPPPWTVEETAPCFIVRDHNRQALAFVYCEDETGRRMATQRLSRNRSKLPGLLRKPRGV